MDPPFHLNYVTIHCFENGTKMVGYSTRNNKHTINGDVLPL